METAKTKKIKSERIEKKLKLSFDLFEAAFEIKKHQLQKKHPDMPQRELNHLTYSHFEKGLK